MISFSLERRGHAFLFPYHGVLRAFHYDVVMRFRRISFRSNYYEEILEL